MNHRHLLISTLYPVPGGCGPRAAWRRPRCDIEFPLSTHSRFIESLSRATTVTDLTVCADRCKIRCHHLGTGAKRARTTSSWQRIQGRFSRLTMIHPASETNRTDLSIPS